MKFRLNRRNLTGVFLSLLLIVFGTWGQVQGSSSGQYNISEPGLHELFNTVLYHLKNDYVEEVSNEDIWFGAIKGMLAATGDAHTRFMTPDEFNNLEVDTKGVFGGLGIEIGMRDSVLTVISPIDDTPAMRAGLQPGDKIVKINGDSTQDLTLNEAVNILRGEPGTSVNISILRDGEDELLSVDIVREEIKIQVVSYGIIEGENLGYVRLKTFSGTATADIAKALQSLLSSNVEGLILDLRWNPGGLLSAAHEIGNFFIDEGVIVSTRGRRSERDRVFEANPDNAIAPKIPLVVLVNGGSASASEIVTGAIKDHKRGTVIGTKTFGKGSVQNVIQMPYNTGIALTIQKYYTPSGESIHKKGIQPDIEVKEKEVTKADKEAVKIIIEKKLLSKFDVKDYSNGSVAEFKKFLKENGVSEISDFAARSLLRQEVLKIGKRPLYDLVDDEPLKRAVKELK